MKLLDKLKEERIKLEEEIEIAEEVEEEKSKIKQLKMKKRFPLLAKIRTKAKVVMGASNSYLAKFNERYNDGK